MEYKTYEIIDIGDNKFKIPDKIAFAVPGFTNVLDINGKQYKVLYAYPKEPYILATVIKKSNDDRK